MIRPRLAILTNLVAPYRAPLYSALNEEFDVLVLCSGMESNRTHWSALQNDAHRFAVKYSAGLVIRRSVERGGKRFADRYFHITPGYCVDLLRFRPAAVISVEMGLRSLAALTYGALFRTPVWVHWGGTKHTEARVTRLKRLARWWFARVVKRWLSYGQTSTDYLLSIGVPADRIVQLQNGVDERAFLAPSVPMFGSAVRPVLLCVGRLERAKGLDEFLRAATRLQNSGLRFSVALVGDGPDRDYFEESVKQLGLRNTGFLGNVEPAKMPSVYRGCDWLVFPTLQDVWGLAINEALWSGLNVVSSKFAGAAVELLSPTHIFDPLDAEDFDRVLGAALNGTLGSCNTDTLWTMSRTAHVIKGELRRVLRPSAFESPRDQRPVVGNRTSSAK